jgi:hypothetical protein
MMSVKQGGCEAVWERGGKGWRFIVHGQSPHYQPETCYSSSSCWLCQPAVACQVKMTANLCRPCQWPQPRHSTPYPDSGHVRVL